MKNYIKSNISEVKSPAYYLDIDKFHERVRTVSERLNEIPLTYSIKANPFLLHSLPDKISHVEACSPGELEICNRRGISGNRIIYSGVNKERSDIRDAMLLKTEIVTAESKHHVYLEQQVAQELKIYQKVLLRLSSGNQFGMSEDDIISVLSNMDEYPNLIFYGIHFYSGTQKRIKQIQADLGKISAVLDRVEQRCAYKPQLVEYGPGLSVEYFNPPYDETELETLEKAAPLLIEFSRHYPIGIELGRFLSADCGTYVTRIKDIKENDETTYLICDGGIHHLKYYGQNMAMQIPDMEACSLSCKKCNYCVCGSLCTTADILVRDVELPEVGIDDVLLFHRCGAYSITEGISLFLSRNLPSVFAFQKDKGLEILREGISTATLNS